MEGADAYTLFKQSVVNEIRELRGLILLRTPDSLEPWTDALEELAQRVNEAEKKIAQLKSQVAKELEVIEKAKQLKVLVDQQQEEIEYIQTHLPARLPGKSPIEVDLSALPPPTKLVDDMPSAPSTSSVTLPSSATSAEPKKPEAKPESKKAASALLQIPTVALVTVSELESTPKYMKGRLTLDKLNAAVEEFQKLLQDKYKILSQPPAKMNDKMLKKYKVYKDAESKETKGLYFLTENDMAESTALRQGDATGKSVIAVLRHLHRIKDLGGTTKRYAVVVG